MKVGLVDNTSFNARFRYNELLEKAMSSADPYDLEDFLNLLNNMERKNDGLEFYLKVVPAPLCGSDYLALYKNGEMFGRRYVHIWNEKGRELCNLILPRITNMLCGWYPNPPRVRQPRERLLNAIYEKLDVNV